MKSTTLMFSLPVLMACATLAPAQSSDVKQSSTDSAKLDALSAQVKQLADSIKSADWEARLKKLESEIQNLKDASVRMETLIKADEARKSYYQAPVTAAKPVVPQPSATLRLMNTTAFVGTVTINGKDYTVLPGQTVLIPGMPTGEFRYEAKVDGFGLLQPAVSRTISASEMFTITLYPR